MEPLPENIIKKKLKNAYWDISVTGDDLYAILQGKQTTLHAIDKVQLFARLLNTYDWYMLMRLIPFSELNGALDDAVLNKLWPKSLRKRYLYARRILFEEPLSITG